MRRGSDIFKAIALGAKAVFVGRPALWGMATGGQAGVEKVISILNEELKETMLLTGCNTIDDIQKKQVIYSDQDIVFPKL